MRARRAALAATLAATSPDVAHARPRKLSCSIARSMLLTLDIGDRDNPKTKHHGTYIIEQSECQLYDPTDSHANRHGQLLRDQLEGEYQKLKQKGFVVAKDDAHARSLRAAGEGFVRFLDKESDHYMHDITVVNNVHKNPDLSVIANAIPFEGFAQRMFVDDYVPLNRRKRKKTADLKRGNLRHDAGITPSLHMGKDIVQGMNFPMRMSASRKLAGIGDDPTLEHTMVKAGCAVQQAMEMVQRSRGGEGGPDLAVNQAIFPDEERNRLFGPPWARELGLGLDVKYDATSCFGTGVTSDDRVVKTDAHTDDQNDHTPGNNHSPTITRLVTVLYEGVWTEVRVGVNIYKKKCGTDAMERYAINEKILGLVQDNSGRPTSEGGDEVPLEAKFVRPTGLSEEDKMWSLPADDNKDGMLSIYANEILRLTDGIGRNRAAMVEALVTLTLTPAPDGWFKTFRGLADFIMECQGADLDDNLFFMYVDFARALHETVAHGNCFRCQVSFGGGKPLTRDEALQTFRNLDACLRFADSSSDTAKIIKKMEAPLSKGGVRFAGPYYAHVILNIAIKVGLVRNRIHLEHVTIAPSTATYKRLVEDYGLKGKEHAKEVIPFLMARLGEKSAITVDNLVCEALRRKYGVRKWDVFVEGHVLFEADGRGVYAVSPGGRRSLFRFLPEGFDVGVYSGVIEWWRTSEPSPGGDRVVVMKAGASTPRKRARRCR